MPLDKAASVYPTERNVTGTSVRLLLDGSGVNLSPDLQSTIYARFDFDYQKPPMFYPQPKYMQMAKFLRREVYSDLPEEQAYEEMGRGIVRAYFEGSIGQVVKMTAAMLGPKVGSKTFLKVTKQCMPWANHEYEVGDNFFRYRLRLVPGPPGIMRGIMKESVEAAGAKLLRATTTIYGEEDFLHEVEWG